MRIFVTGATGVVGKRAIPLLVSQGHAVTALIHSSQKRADIERSGAIPAEADLFDRDSLTAAIEGHDAVVNLATHMPASSFRMFMPGAWRENDRIRSQGSVNVMRAAHVCGVERLIQESFAPAYPDHGDAWIDETMPLSPAHYNRSVIDAERAAEYFTKQGGAGVMLRFAAFYGPDARHIADLVRSVRHGFAPLLGPSETFISSVSHDDAALAVAAALELPAGAYNVCDNEPLSHRDYVDSLADALGVPHPKLPPVWTTAITGSVGKTLARSLRIANHKLRENSNWRPTYRSVREGWDSVLPMIESPREQAA